MSKQLFRVENTTFPRVLRMLADKLLSAFDAAKYLLSLASVKERKFPTINFITL
ncbi:hypothetical protein [uncultured Metabacillus sp.]|uniref:hypothetical protein n=1 Tax=Metabacillus sp. Hm71 TaxID=3450743 RepID=UPI00262A9CBE|nr:hypothetical protein [uncultured Metabacillus sp.]